ncbi:hypothetical protein E8E13_010420 [Curvularia kusanoi]|uniref:BTB domain-containing protein n=1 Tax=Curvularia kusanoi TaxID=90978 RepID=A0A9P4WCQ6_CURKU|nr:hypothetical protein E8E13_010420 [Curvularia kusanoi]
MFAGIPRRLSVPSSVTVTIDAGTGTDLRRFDAESYELTSRSRRFREIFSDQLYYNLPDIESETFEVYLQYIRGTAKPESLEDEEIVVQSDDTLSVEKDDIAAERLRLAKVWLIADHFEDVSTKNIIAKAMLHSIFRVRSWREWLLPDERLVKFVWENMGSDSEIRALIMKVFVHSEWDDINFQDYGQAFCGDVALALLKIRSPSSVWSRYELTNRELAVEYMEREEEDESEEYQSEASE